MRKWYVFIIVGLVCCGGGDRETVGLSEETETPSLRSVVMVIAHRDFQDEELQVPYRLMQQAGYRIVIASTDTTEARGMLGMTVKPDITIEQIRHDDYEAIIVVGGSGCETLWDNETLHGVLRSFRETQKVVAAICIAPVVLGRAGILNDLDVTAYPAVKDDIDQCGGVYTGNDVEKCGQVITCSGPQAVQEFGKTILSTLSEP